MGGCVIEADRRLGLAHDVGERTAARHNDDAAGVGRDGVEPVDKPAAARLRAAEFENGEGFSHPEG